jgi:hypothetical protein
MLSDLVEITQTACHNCPTKMELAGIMHQLSATIDLVCPRSEAPPSSFLLAPCPTSQKPRQGVAPPVAALRHDDLRIIAALYLRGRNP